MRPHVIRPPNPHGLRTEALTKALREAVATDAPGAAQEALARGAPPDGFLEDLSLLAHAVRHGQDAIAEHLIAAGADVNAQRTDTARYPSNFTPLMWAAQRANAPLMRRLLARGAGLHARSGYGHDAMICALISDTPPVPVRVLLEHGYPARKVLSEEAPFLVRASLQRHGGLVGLLRAWQTREALAPGPSSEDFEAPFAQI